MCILHRSNRTRKCKKRTGLYLLPKRMMKKNDPIEGDKRRISIGIGSEQSTRTNTSGRVSAKPHKNISPFRTDQAIDRDCKRQDKFPTKSTKRILQKIEEPKSIIDEIKTLSINDSQQEQLAKDTTQPRTRKIQTSTHSSRKSQINVFEDYWSEKLVEKALHDSRVFQGRIRVNAYYPSQAYVTLENLPVDVLIDGFPDRNRALHSDIVIIHLHKVQKWKKTRRTDLIGQSSMTSPNRNTYPEIESATLSSDTITESVSCSQNEDTSDTQQATTSHYLSTISQLAKQHQLRPTAKVIAIQLSQHQHIIGYFRPIKIDQSNASSTKNATFYPIELGFPHQILIPPSEVPVEFHQKPLLRQNTLFSCRIDVWSVYHRYPLGRDLTLIGNRSSIHTNVRAILFKEGLSTHAIEFSKQISQQLEDTFLSNRQNWTIPSSELSARTDFRSLSIFSIDPAGARDLDDALHIRCLDAQKQYFEIGVHIADVSHFLQKGSELDEEARKRTTSVYLTDRMYSMLPHLLSEKLCSLQPQEDRLAVSIVWKMDGNGSVIDNQPWIGTSVIHSRYQLDYKTAQMMLDGVITIDNLKAWDLTQRPRDVKECQLIIKSVKSLWRVAEKRREIRIQSGALMLSNTKLKFELDKDGHPIEFGECRMRDSNRLVEEFMLQANYFVAGHLIQWLGPLSFLRCHAAPSELLLKQSIACLKETDIEIDITSSKSIAHCLSRLSSTNARMCHYLLTKAMKSAHYMVAAEASTSIEWHHYALNVPFYTHFTSPIRRYADVVVHRLLKMSLGGQLTGNQNDFRSVFNEKNIDTLLLELKSVARLCNEKKLALKKAVKACDIVFLCGYLHRKKSIQVQGIVASIGTHSLTVYVIEFGLEYRIEYSNLGLRGKRIEEDGKVFLIAHLQHKKKGKAHSYSACVELRISFMTTLNLRVTTRKKTPFQLAFQLIDVAETPSDTPIIISSSK